MSNLDRIPASNYAELLLSGIPMIDLRAPVEFAKGAFPGSINLPLMNDSERAKVGTCYKEHGQQAAIELGHQLVRGKTKQARVDAWLAQVSEHPDTVLYCFRGGMRSEISQGWLAEAGVQRPFVEGGYKGMRGFLVAETERLAKRDNMVIVGGMTGCGKTDFLLQRPGAVDLEGLANHRGSSFGRRLGGQPPQISFENELALALLRHERAGHPQLILEDESRLIGRESLPLTFFESMGQAPRVLLDVTQEARIQQITKDYVVQMHADYLAEEKAQGEGNEETAFEAFSEYLLGSLDRIRKRLGGARHQELRQAMLDALALQRSSGDVDAHRHWINPLLVDYYDPMYHYQLEKKTSPVLFQGTPEAVAQYLDERQQQR